MSTTNLPPWDPSTFVFDLQGNVPQCTNATWQYWGSDTSNPAPSPPYHGVLYAGGYQPYMIQFDNTAVTGATNWTANLPPGSSFGVSMFDSKNYTSGVLERKLMITPQTNCTVSNPLKPSTLDVEVTGTRGQCEMAFVNIKNGTGPYKLEIVPLSHEQKTIYFESSPLGFVLDMSPGIEYWLAHYDSAGNSAVMGPYIITATADNRCLGVASTITAGRFSTLYPGGTTTSGATATATSATSNRLATPAIIGIAIAAPITAIAITALCLWFCYKRNRSRHGSEGKPEIEPAYNYHHTEYTPVPTTATHYSGSYHDVSVTGQYNPVVPVPYPLPPMSVSDRNTIYTAGEMSTSEPSSMGLSEKRRHLVNPDAHSLGPVDAEPFDPSLISGPSESRTQSGLPLLPPAYSPS